MIEKLKRRTVWLKDADAGTTDAAAALLRDVRGVMSVRAREAGRLVVGYNVRQITLQTITELLREFGYELRTSLFCRLMRWFCYYIEDIECTECRHDQAGCTRDAFIERYLSKEHGCRDQRPDYLRRYL